MDVGHLQSGPVVHTGEPHLQGSYMSIRLWVTSSDGEMLLLSKGEHMVSLTIPAGLRALADDGAPDVHRGLSGARQQTRLQHGLFLLREDDVQTRCTFLKPEPVFKSFSALPLP